jgi:hypothetical protein
VIVAFGLFSVEQMQGQQCLYEALDSSGIPTLDFRNPQGECAERICFQSAGRPGKSSLNIWSASPIGFDDTPHSDMSFLLRMSNDVLTRRFQGSTKAGQPQGQSFPKKRVIRGFIQ